MLFINAISFAQQAITQRLTTSGIEHTSTIRGVLKYAFDNEDRVRKNGESYIFTNGFSTSVQMGGFDEEGNLGVCANYYYSHNNTDFHSGLLAEGSGLLIEGSDEFYDKIWKIHDFEIIELQEKHNSGNLSVEDLTEDIKTWPGKGNPFVDPLFVSDEIAPFFDSDLDGVYNPMLGDYPVVSSKQGMLVPSQFTFNIYHDLGFHAITLADTMKMQFYQTQYVINCNDGDLERTVFTILKTKSYNSTVWKDSYLGLYVDHDLGCYTSDKFGFDGETNSVYTYNQGGYDDAQCPEGYPIHNSISTVKSIIFDDPIHTLSSVKPNVENSIPNNGLAVYNRLSGLFSDGTPITYGGDGYNTTSHDTVLHLYSDFPNEPLGWSQETIEVEDSRYGFFTSIALGDISPGETNQIEFAEIVMVSETEEGLDIFNSYRNRVSDLNEAQIRYINDEDLCPKIEICTEECVWPGDANNNGRVDNDDYIYIAAASTTEDITSRDLTDTEWYAHTSDNWGSNATMVDLKHCDANGNGKINSWDTRVVNENFGLKNDSYEEIEVPAFIGDPFGLYFDNIKEDYSVTGTSSSKHVTTKLLIGDDDFNISDSIIGISYDISWDISKMELEIASSSLANIFFWDEFNLEGPTLNDFYDIENTTKIHAAQFNFSQNVNEGGRLVQLRWELKDDATTTNTDGRDTVDIIFTDIFALNANGEEVEVGLREQYSVIIKNLEVVDPVAVNDLVSNNRLSVYPNPTSNILNYDCADCGNIAKVSLISLGAKSIIETHPSKIHSIDVSTIPVGLYILKVASEKGVYTKKVFVE